MVSYRRTMEKMSDENFENVALPENPNRELCRLDQTIFKDFVAISAISNVVVESEACLRSGCSLPPYQQCVSESQWESMSNYCDFENRVKELQNTQSVISKFETLRSQWNDKTELVKHGEFYDAEGIDLVIVKETLHESLKMRLEGAMPIWTLENHRLFNAEFKQSIVTLLMCLQRCDIFVPKDVLILFGNSSLCAICRYFVHL